MDSDRPDFTDIDPSTASTIGDFATLLRRVRARADNPSFRDLERWGEKNGTALPRQTLGDVLAGRRPPRRQFLITFLRACSMDDTDANRWIRAWERLAEGYHLAPGDHRGSAHQPTPSTQADSFHRTLYLETKKHRDKLIARVKTLADKLDPGPDVQLSAPVDEIRFEDIETPINIDYAWYCRRCNIGGNNQEITECPRCCDVARQYRRPLTVKIPFTARVGTTIRLRNVGMSTDEGAPPGNAMLLLVADEPPF